MKDYLLKLLHLSAETNLEQDAIDEVRALMMKFTEAGYAVSQKED